MSRIRFEWNVESEQVERFDGEDPQAKRRRRRNLLLLVTLVCTLLAAIALGLLFLRQRVHEVETQFAQLLQDTVKAEVAALRIGDLYSFLNAQDANDLGWINEQRAAFQRYSELKAEGAIGLTGSILAVEIDRERARVLVQEDLNELPYARLWFYRRGGEGWRHIAPDHSFWGEASAIETSRVLVNYRAADHEFALQVSAALEDWIKRGCDILDCGDLPRLIIDILPEAAESVAWIDEAALRLQIRSPYTDIARADKPFDGQLQVLASTLLAERLVSEHSNNLEATYPHDAYFMQRRTIAWLSEVFTRFDRGALLMRSIADNYGSGKIAQLLARLDATSNMSVLAPVLDQPLEDADLDWRDFIEWRLTLEDELISAGRQNQWLGLYDTVDEGVRLTAYQRYSRGAIARSYQVVDQVIWSSPNGWPQLRATVQVSGAAGATEEIVLFNLVNGVWKRAS